MKWRKHDIGVVASHDAVSCPECYGDTGGAWYSREGKRWTQCCERCQGVVLIYTLRPEKK